MIFLFNNYYCTFKIFSVQLTSTSLLSTLLILMNAHLSWCRIKTAEKQYTDAFEDELHAFIERVQGRAKVRLEEARKQAEEASGVCGHHRGGAMGVVITGSMWWAWSSLECVMDMVITGRGSGCGHHWGGVGRSLIQR